MSLRFEVSWRIMKGCGRPKCIVFLVEVCTLSSRQFFLQCFGTVGSATGNQGILFVKISANRSLFRNKFTGRRE